MHIFLEHMRLTFPGTIELTLLVICTGYFLQEGKDFYEGVRAGREL